MSRAHQILRKITGKLRLTLYFLTISMLLMQSFALPALAQSVVISEAMVNPVVVTASNGQWIELHNTTNQPQDITGYSVTVNGTSYLLSQENLVAGSGFTLPAKGFFLMCANSDTSQNGGMTCNYDWDGFELTTSETTLGLNNSEDEQVDKIEYNERYISESDSLVIERDENNQPVLEKDDSNNYNGIDSGTPGTANVDSDVPFVEIISPSENAKVRGIVSVVGNVSDTNLTDYRIEVFDSTMSNVYDSDWLASSSDFIENQELALIDTAQFIDGDYTIVLTARDDNSLENETQQTISIDNTAPIITINKLDTNNSSPTLTGTIDDTGATVEITLNERTYTAVTNNGTWSLNIPNISDGIYDVTAVATDEFGNVGVDSTSNELQVDTTAPVVTVNKLTTTSHHPVISGTVDDTTARIYVTVHGKKFQATNNADGTWVLKDVKLVASGVYGTFDVIVEAIDNFGNSGFDTTTDELTIKNPISSAIDKISTVVYAADSTSGNAEQLDSDGDGIPDYLDETPFGDNDKDEDTDNDNSQDKVTDSDKNEEFDWGWVLLAGAAVAFLWFLLRSKEE